MRARARWRDFLIIFHIHWQRN